MIDHVPTFSHTSPIFCSFLILPFVLPLLCCVDVVDVLFPWIYNTRSWLTKTVPTHSVLSVSKPILLAQALASLLDVLFPRNETGLLESREKSSKKTRADGKHKLVYYQLWSLPHTQLMFVVSTFLQRISHKIFGRFNVRSWIAGFLRRASA